MARLKAPFTEEEVEEVIKLIDSDGSGDLDYKVRIVICCHMQIATFTLYSDSVYSTSMCVCMSSAFYSMYIGMYAVSMCMSACVHLHML